MKGAYFMEDDLSIVGKRLKELRTERQLTMDMVVEDLNNKYDIEITRGHLSKWENNVNSPSLRLAAYLCKFYGVSLDYLLGLTDSRVPVDLLVKTKGKSKK